MSVGTTPPPRSDLVGRRRAERGAAGVPRILVVDDDDDLRTLLEEQLREHGFDPYGCGRGLHALELIRSCPPSLVLLDLGLPDIAGLEVLRRIRQFGVVPVMVVTGRGSEADRVVGLELGADDYVVKPFSQRELAARVKAVLRRAAPPTPSADSRDHTDTAPATPNHSRLDFGSLVIDRRTRDVVVGDRLVELTAKEFDLLVFLASSPRQVFSRTQLLEHVWGFATADWQRSSTVAEHVHRLRRKITPDPSARKWIHTLRGVGYRFEP